MDSEEQVEALAGLPRDLALMKMENDTIVSMAAARPRDYAKILDDLVAQLEAYPSFAEGAIYCKPVGKDRSGVMQFATGLSVRAAEALSEAYGFNRVSTRAEPVEGTESMRVTASFTDYQRGRVWEDSIVASPYYTDRNGNMRRNNDDRFLNVVLKAERSKLVREVILRSVPAGLKSELEAAAARAQEQGLTEEQAQKIIAAWEGKGVPLADLEALLGKARANWSKAERARLLHLWQSAEDGELSASEVVAAAKESAASDGFVAAEGEEKEPATLKDKLRKEEEPEEKAPAIPDEENPFMGVGQ